MQTRMLATALLAVLVAAGCEEVPDQRGRVPTELPAPQGSESGADGGPGALADLGASVKSDLGASAKPDHTLTPKPDSKVTPPPSNLPYAKERQLCVDLVNGFRAKAGVPALTRRTSSEACADQQAAADAASQTPHGTGGQCGDRNQSQSDGDGFTVAELLQVSIAGMYAEGPGSGLSHAHYMMMVSTLYTQVACGFNVSSGPFGASVWVVIDYF